MKNDLVLVTNQYCFTIVTMANSAHTENHKFVSWYQMYTKALRDNNVIYAYNITACSSNIIDLIYYII